MKDYLKPDLEIIEFAAEDIATGITGGGISSGGDGFGDNGDSGL